MTAGVPLPRQWCRDDRLLAMSDPSGAAVPLQSRTLDRWPDGSVRWALVDFQASCGADTSTHYSVRVDDAVRPPTDRGVSVRHAAPRILVSTGAADFEFAVDAFPFSAVRAGSNSVIDCTGTRFTVEGDDGRVHTAAIGELVVEESGPMRACLRFNGTAGPWLRVIARLHVFSGSPVVRLVLTIQNPRPARHPGGIWELGDAGSTFIADAALTIRLGDRLPDAELRCSAEAGSPFARCELPLELFQASSGGPNWNCSNHVNRFGNVSLPFRGYRYRCGSSETRGLQASPIAWLTSADQNLAAALPAFWQNFPKAIEATPRSVTLRLFPRQAGDFHELQGGEQKTHTVFIAVGDDRIGAAPLDWTRQPLAASMDPEWYAHAEAVPYLVPAAADPSVEYLQLVGAAIDGPAAFTAKREIIDEYGWRNFGDLYADHEAALQSAGNPPLVSHYNNQYDAVAGFGIHFFRTGDGRWLHLMRDLAAHVVDIDCYHTTGDKSAYNRGLFWHTYHYVDAGKSTHRSYPKITGVAGGGPSNEHDYSTGLMLHYFLTGDPRMRDAVIELARWVVDMDDGRRSVFRWVARGDTGLASASGSADYHGPGRGAAYSIVTLLNAYRLDDNAAWFDKAEQLIRRCIHPHDDIGARQLHDVERRWFYTVFLQALGRFLDVKIERGDRGFMYAYARESLLHYARWMAEHEHPYLEQPAILEYPNETWAAQDMRKSEVFKLAALHSSGTERARFVERANFFFRYSTTTLLSMSTSSYARPLVLMLGNGYMQSWFDRNPQAAAPPPDRTDHDFGQPVAFVSQRARAIRRLKIGAVLFGVAVLALVSALWL